MNHDYRQRTAGLGPASTPFAATGALPEAGGELNALRQELVACHRLALLGNITAMVAHEMNNLLTPILARTEAALTTPDDVEFMRKTLARVLVNAQRAKSVAERLVTAAQGQNGEPESCVLADAVRDALETMTRPLEKDGIQLCVEVPPDLRVRANHDLLCQVLLNLLLNARRAMSGTPGLLTISAAMHGDFVIIDVRDSGAGIPAEVLRDVFNPFLAANPVDDPRDWQKVGLGLSVCRLIASHHGAQIHALSNEGRGCTFRLTWPCAKTACAAPVAAC